MRNHLDVGSSVGVRGVSVGTAVFVNDASRCSGEGGRGDRELPVGLLVGMLISCCSDDGSGDCRALLLLSCLAVAAP